MAHYMIRTSVEEADEIAKGNKTFIFRDESFKYGYGDDISFIVCKFGKPTRHPIDGKKFRVTYVSTEAPIDKGWKVVGFRRA